MKVKRKDKKKIKGGNIFGDIFDQVYKTSVDILTLGNNNMKKGEHQDRKSTRLNSSH